MPFRAGRSTVRCRPIQRGFRVVLVLVGWRVLFLSLSSPGGRIAMSETRRRDLDHPGRPKQPAPGGGGQPPLIVVPHRPGGFSPMLLPPLFIVLLGAGFIAYRVRTPDWRGLSFEWSWPTFGNRPTSTPAPAPILALKTEPAKPELVPPRPVEPAKPKDEPKPSPDLAGKAAAEVDPLGDIEREAEKTRERIATLEKLKEQESQKLAETEDERRQADRGLLRGRRIPPDQLRKMIEAHRAQLAQQMAMIEEFQRRQFDRMAQLHPDFFRPGRMGMLPDPFATPKGNGMFPGFEGFMPMPQGGVTQLREWRGPNGMRGFEMRWRSRPARPEPGDTPPPPPPPRPEARIID
jgi:hypothetical protein